jgi:fluoroacetyl-CoA thioesterase
VTGMSVGLRGELNRTVGAEDTALALGSGDLAVLATPRLVAWAEAATCGAVADALDPRQTTVGTRVVFHHVRGSSIGQQVKVNAQLVRVEGRVLRFDCTARSVSDGTVLAHGELTRVVVGRDRFIKGLRKAD